MKPVKLLLVDDEPNVRVTLAEILKRSGFDVEVCATVRDAVSAITSRSFDVLIADLNIGEPGDGFTVISAMRRTQPRCVNFILTGYPAFETALRAIRTQVDDYLVKPTEPEVLLEKINAALRSPRSAAQVPSKRVPVVLRENIDRIRERVLQLMKSNAELRLLPLTDEQRVDHVPSMLCELVDLLESPEPDKLDVPPESSVRHGRERHRQGYQLPMLVEDARILESAVFETVQQCILELELSYLISDLKKVVETIQWQLHESTRAFLKSERTSA